MPDNGLFDVVSAFDLIEHVPDPQALPQTVWRIAQGGRHADHQYAGHGARAALRDAVPLADAPTHATPVSVLPSGARAGAYRRRLRGHPRRHRVQDSESRVSDQPDQASEPGAVARPRHRLSGAAGRDASEDTGASTLARFSPWPVAPEGGMPSTTTTTKVPPRRALGQTLRQCPICASTELGYEFIVDGCPVCRCEHCGLLFLNPQPAGADTQTGDGGAAPMPASVYESACLERRFATGPADGLCRRESAATPHDRQRCVPDGGGGAARSTSFPSPVLRLNVAR